MDTYPFTELYYHRMFMARVNEFKATVCPNTYSMVAINIAQFHLFNKLHGRQAGDELLKYIVSCLKDMADAQCGIAGYMGADNFVIFMPNEMKLFEELRDEIIKGVRIWDNTIVFLPLIGVYPMDDATIPAEEIYDRAVLARAHIPEKNKSRICLYNALMETKMEEEVRLLSEIQYAMDHDEFTFYVQPQCHISTGKIVGAEALVRWIHPENGLISPGVFIPVMEKNGLITQLDCLIWKKVCQWMRGWIDRGFTPVPLSINISRNDILSMDVPSYLSELLANYDLPEKLLKAEITESAYAENNNEIDRTVQRLRDNGLIVMMDDFGCGYSSLNMLKNVAVDVLKLDMRFLDMDESDEEKGIGILESIVNMARLMRLPIVVEGVETQTQERFLLNMGCQYTQGYYYYKPMPIDQFETLLTDERRLDFAGLLYKQVEPLHVREFLDDNFFSDMMINNILGPVAFYEMQDNQIEITRVNEQYYYLVGSYSDKDTDYGRKFWNHISDEDRPTMYTIFQQAYENPFGGADGYVHFVAMDGSLLWVYMKVFFLKETDGKKLFYSSLMDMTAQQESDNEEKKPLNIQPIADLTPEEYRQMNKYYEYLPCGYSVAKIFLDRRGIPEDFEIVYTNHEMQSMCNGDLKQLKAMMLHALADKEDEIFEIVYRAAYLGETIDYKVYSSISNRYLQLKFYQQSYGYVGCMMNDVTHMHIYENALDSVMLGYREAYFVHLQENHCRMIYPTESHVLERGNYEEIVNRHFMVSKISVNDERNVRKFLSLDNLREVLKIQDTTEFAYRRKSPRGEDEWCLTSVTVSERDKNGHPLIAILVIKSIDELIRDSRSKRVQDMAEALANMSEGFLVYRAVGDERILYANPKVVEIYGCETLDEFMELVNGSFMGMVHPEDLERVEWEIHDQIDHSDGNMDFIKYRITRKDGEIRWIDDVGHLENATIASESALFYVFIWDITDTITEGQKTKLLNRSKYFCKE